MDSVLEFLKKGRDALASVSLEIGGNAISLWDVVTLLVLTALLLYLSGRVRNWIVLKLMARSQIDIGVRQAFGTIFRYVVVIIGLIIIVETVGIDLSALTIVAGALGVGVGFGLQSITNNVVSGLVILFERPIKVGDRIQVGDVAGDVMDISARATTVRTNDNISIIVPNSDFITEKVINWSHSDRIVRIHVPVGVAYKSDPERVRQVLLQIADAHPGVLKSPAPDVVFEEFGDSALKFVLRVWTSQYIAMPTILQSDLNFAIKKQLKEAGIEIPFPQRDLHLRTSDVDLRG
jgi:small-conductance mechanosensitive channel